jgi:hypothetical protein
MKQIVRNADGELTYGSMAEVKVLYQQGFISPDDEIRAEDSTRWAKCGSLRILAEAQSRGKRETGMAFRLAVAFGVSVILAGAVQRERWVLIGGLVFLGVLIPFFVYRKKQ